MTNILVLLEAHDGELRAASLEAVGAARQAAGDGSVIAFAPEGEPDPAVVGAAGADLLLTSGAATHSADGTAATAVNAAAEHDCGVVFVAATARGKDVAPRIAAGMGAGYLADCTAVAAEGDTLSFTRPVYAGKAILTAHATGAVVAGIRPNSFAPAGRDQAAEVGSTSPAEGIATVVEVKASSSDRPDVAEANIIVSGGRGMGGPENWGLLEAVADALPGAALGASRAAVDAGWRPHSEQVGQTGKTVSPNLYIACGISGAIQHLAGMSSSKTIVAINKDAEAPIFQAATYGIVGDIAEVLPALEAALKTG